MKKNNTKHQKKCNSSKTVFLRKMILQVIDYKYFKIIKMVFKGVQKCCTVCDFEKLSGLYSESYPNIYFEHFCNSKCCKSVHFLYSGNSLINSKLILENATVCNTFEQLVNSCKILIMSVLSIKKDPKRSKTTVAVQ